MTYFRAQDIAEKFGRFAHLEEVLLTPIYSHLCEQIADDPEPYVPFANALQRGQPIPNMLLAGIHYVLQTQPEHPLAKYYASLTDRPKPHDNKTYPHFREFYLANEDELLEVAQTRRTQTNEVRRCAVLLPVYGVATALSNAMPLSLIEIGCSGGLNLSWDQYGYQYDNGQQAGNPQSLLQIDTIVKGNNPLPLSDLLPEVAFRCGIDLHPLDIQDEADVRWLKALVWPEPTDRVVMMDSAISIARENPPRLIKGDVLAVLPDITPDIPADSAPIFYHTFVTYQFSQAMRDELTELIQTQAQHFEHAFYLSIEWLDASYAPMVHLTHYVKGKVQSRDLLARCTGHARWVEWY